MKKITSKLLLLMMVLVMAFGLAACGSDDKKETTTSGTTTGGTSQTQAPATDSKSSGKMYSSISDYLNDATVKEALSTMEKSVSGSGMNIKVTSEDDKLIYTFTYEKLEKTDEMAKQLEEGIKAQDATFQSTANQVKQYVDVDSATVGIKYVDSKGEEIYSKEYVSE